MNAHDLLDAVGACGYRVTVTPTGAPRLVKRDPGAAPVPGELLQLLRDRRGEVLESLIGCEECGRAVCEEDAAALAEINPLCGETACPYRRRERR